MQINVSQLLREPVGSVRDYQVNEVADISGEIKGCLVQGECSLLRTPRSVLIKCSLSVEVQLTCSRCLSQFRCPLTLNFEEEYSPSIDIATGMSLPLPEEAGAFTIDEHHILDLTEAIRQYAVLAIPMKPLCSEDCAGLCPSCGHNLSQGQCDCPTHSIDPRLSELKKLL